MDKKCYIQLLMRVDLPELTGN